MKWRARISPKTLIIAAASARAFVRAAAASGRHVIAADVFCDLDTQKSADESIRLGYRNGGFVAEDVRSLLLPRVSGSVGFVFGSGFESQPELLDDFANRGVYFGNNAETVRALKSPDRFFSLLAGMGIPYPGYVLDPPVDPEGWLAKSVGGSGGTHIRVATADHTARHYYQRVVEGLPVSLLFAADGNSISEIGFNLQLLSPAQGMPYRYGGAVSRWSVPASVQDRMRNAAESITRVVGLRGLNSIDCLVDGEQLWVLEVNPRLSATFSLYDAEFEGARLFEAHLQACNGLLPQCLPQEPSQAHLIYYAPFDFAVPAAMTWPEWVADIPEAASRCEAQQPLCTVKASAAKAEDALALALKRSEALAALLTKFLNNSLERS